MPRSFKQASEILPLLEGGDLHADLSTEMMKVIEACRDAAGAKGSASGTLTLKLGFTVTGVDVQISSNISATVPKQPRSTSHMFVTDEGLSREHPRQRNLFEGGSREDDVSHG